MFYMRSVQFVTSRKMLLIFYNALLFAMFAKSIAVPDRAIYLTDEDFALSKTLSSTGPNGTIFNPPNNEMQSLVRSLCLLKTIEIRK